MRPLNDLLVALSLLTRLPLKLDETRYDRSAHAAWAYPLVGVVTGAVSAGLALIALTLGLPSTVCALLAIAAGAALTGAMHEDGLADCADGFWGGWDPEMRLKIMKDSQIGTYGVMALVVTIGLRTMCLAVLIETLGPYALGLTLMSVHVASRAVMPALMTSLPNARGGGLSAQVGQVSASSAVLAAFIGTCALYVAIDWAAGSTTLIGLVLVLLVWRAIARRKIGGQTGDVLGAGQQISEVTAFVTLTALL